MVMRLDEAKQILTQNGYLLEASKYDEEYQMILKYFPDAKDLDIHVNRSIRSPLWKTLYGWECEFKLNGRNHWFTFGRGWAGFTNSFEEHIAKYCKLKNFQEYLDIKKDYPDATLEDIRNISEMG